MDNQDQETVTIEIFVGEADEDTIRKRMREAYLLGKRMKAENQAMDVMLQEVDEPAPPECPGGLRVVKG